MNNVIEVHELTKTYDSKFQLGSLNLEIPSGMIIGLIGENGAGKTTLIKLLLGIIKQDQGTIKILGHDVDAIKAKEEIGVVLDNMFFPEILTPKEIDMIMKDIYKSWDTELFKQYINKFQLPLEKTLKSLSKGMRKKVEIITALSHHPKLLILDEPTSGLDPVVRNDVLEVFQEFIQDENHTILLSTHITSDLEHIADDVIFLNKGNIVFHKMRDEIFDSYAILKCDMKQFEKIECNDIICYRKNGYSYDVLVKDKTKIKKKYKNYIMDNITLEELMVLMIKGEKIC